MDAWWSPDSDRIVIKVPVSIHFTLVLSLIWIQTSESHLVLISVEVKVDEAVIVPPVPSTSNYTAQQKTFLEGPGEGLQRQAVSLHFEGVVRVDGEVLRSARLFGMAAIGLTIT